jgi:hypothetical protein
MEAGDAVTASGARVTTPVGLAAGVVADVAERLTTRGSRAA